MLSYPADEVVGSPSRLRRIASTIARVIVRTMHDITERVRAEYLEMPGMRLKPEQVQRLCGIERQICQIVLATLVEAKFLYATPDGQYARLVDGHSTRSLIADSRNGIRSKKAS